MKAICKALMVLDESYKEATGSTTSPGEVVAARAEVAAIVRAAKVISKNVKIPAIPAELEPALLLLGSIAKDAP